ncbi:putative rossmann-like alpha/beta/alpha sandwich protein [Helianthus anomalus]
MLLVVTVYVQQDVIPVVESDLRKITAQVGERAKELCRTKSILSMQVDDVIVEVAEGDPRNVLCEAVERHRATTIAMVMEQSKGTLLCK